MLKKTFSMCACLALASYPALAGNGHFLHGVGAVNSSMGGVAAAVPVEVIGALHVNPAMLTSFEGYEVAFGAEVFTDGPEATVEFEQGSPFFPPGGTFKTEGDTEPGVIPAFGLVYHAEGSPWAFGFGLLGVAGFRTDWPAQTVTDNPIFVPQPAGFGTVKTNLSIVKIPFTLAYQVSPKLSLGASLNVYQGGLAISPLPPATPDCEPNTDPNDPFVLNCFYPDADNVVSAYAVGLQVGFVYALNPTWNVGFSYTTPQDFEDYVWNSQHANPNLPNFGEAYEIRYPLDGPQIVSAGLGYQPSSKLKVGFDVRWVDYSSVDGAGGTGGFKPHPLNSLNDIGWRDIWIGAIGLQYQASSAVTLRGGFNYSQTPIRSEVAFTSLGTPPTFEDHYTVGLGYHATDKIELNLGAYWAPRREVSGPLLNPFLVPNQQGLQDQQVEGGTFTISEEIISGLASFTFRF